MVGTAGGPPHCSSAFCNGNLPLPVTKGHLMPNFHHNMMGVGPLCDHGCRVLFEKNLLLFLPNSTQSYYVDSVKALEPICGGSPSSPKSIHRCHQNGAMTQPHSMNMTSQVWEPVSGQCLTGRPKRLTDRPYCLWLEDRI